MKLYESLFILSKSINTINVIWETLNRDQHIMTTNPELAISYINLVNLETVIFFEEFDNFKKNIEPQFHSRIIDLRKIIAPIRDRIKEWRHLSDFRNNFIAHPWRDKQGNFVIPDTLDYNIPRNPFEIGVLTHLMKYIYAIIKEEFKLEHKHSVLYMTQKIPPPLPERDYSNLNQDHLLMAQEVSEVCQSLGRNYHLRVLQYIFSQKGEDKGKPPAN